MEEFRGWELAFLFKPVCVSQPDQWDIQTPMFHVFFYTSCFSLGRDNFSTISLSKPKNVHKLFVVSSLGWRISIFACCSDGAGMARIAFDTTNKNWTLFALNVAGHIFFQKCFCRPCLKWGREQVHHKSPYKRQMLRLTSNHFESFGFFEIHPRWS